MYKNTAYKLEHLLNDIGSGKLALPDIQRPFVWKPAQVRDLFDSLYRGFPVGTLMLWETGAEVGTKQVGGGANEAVPKLLIIDGQQRLTSLYSVMKGVPVLTAGFEKKQIRIAFRPVDESFEVTDAAIRSDPEFISDITVLWKGKFKKTVQSYLDRLAERRGAPLDEEEEERLETAIDRVRDLRSFPFQVIEMSDQADEEAVAEIFTRINSKGINLSQADFVLTLLSVHWEQGRSALERFARNAIDPRAAGSTANPFIAPSPDQMLRVSVGLAFRRGRMQTIYQVLRGKDLQTGETSAGRRDDQFARLRRAQGAVLDGDNWRRFLRCLRRAGFRSRRTVTSDNALLFSYLLWLTGREDFGIAHEELEPTIARWFFMTHTTGRYTSSPETVIEADLRRLASVEAGDGAAFCTELDRIIGATFTPDYWKITLPSKLDGTAAKSPALSAYWAALYLLDAEVLFSDTSVRDLLDPDISGNPDPNPERDYLFPRAHLSKQGWNERQQRALANTAFVEWPADLRTGQAPMDYWETVTRRFNRERIERHTYWHALPPGWQTADYDEFLEQRRGRMAKVVHDAFVTLGRSSDNGSGSILDLIRAGETQTVEFKSTARTNLVTKQKDAKMQHAIAKAVCGFMNNEGGVLLIGVGDDGEILGIEDEMAPLTKPNQDGFGLMVADILTSRLSFPIAKTVGIRFERCRGRTLCCIQVGLAPKPVFSKPPNGSQPIEFWVRQGASTIQLFGDKAFEYQKQRFH